MSVINQNSVVDHGGYHHGKQWEGTTDVQTPPVSFDIILLMMITLYGIASSITMIMISRRSRLGNRLCRRKTVRRNDTSTIRFIVGCCIFNSSPEASQHPQLSGLINLNRYPSCIINDIKTSDEFRFQEYKHRLHI